MQKHFVRRGVSVTIPDQDRVFEIEGAKTYDPDLKQYTEMQKSEEDVFKFGLVRLVINLKVTEQGKPPELVTFAPGKEMVLVVGLTAADLAHLDEETDPKLAYWHPQNKVWTDLEATADARRTKLEATIDHWWPDPALGVGR